ncbi:MAG: hypothetical protein AAFN27_04110, partial [Pseudomonadota bacterium]
MVFWLSKLRLPESHKPRHLAGLRNLTVMPQMFAVAMETGVGALVAYVVRNARILTTHAPRLPSNQSPKLDLLLAVTETSEHHPSKHHLSRSG